MGDIAKLAKINHAEGLVVDDKGNIYIADDDIANMAIRKTSDAGNMFFYLVGMISEAERANTWQGDRFSLLSIVLYAQWIIIVLKVIF